MFKKNCFIFLLFFILFSTFSFSQDLPSTYYKNNEALIPVYESIIHASIVKGENHSLNIPHQYLQEDISKIEESNKKGTKIYFFYYKGKKIGEERIKFQDGKKVAYRKFIHLSKKYKLTVKELYTIRGNLYLQIQKIVKINSEDIDYTTADELDMIITLTRYRKGKVFKVHNDVFTYNENSRVISEYYEIQDGDSKILSKAATNFIYGDNNELIQSIYGEAKLEDKIDYLAIHFFDLQELQVVMESDNSVYRDDERLSRVKELIIKDIKGIRHFVFERDIEGKKLILEQKNSFDFENTYVLIVNGDIGQDGCPCSKEKEEHLRHKYRVEESYAAFKQIGIPDDKIIILSSYTDFEFKGKEIDSASNVHPRAQGTNDGRGTIGEFINAINLLNGILSAENANLLVYFTGHGERISGQAALVLEDELLFEDEIRAYLSVLNYESLAVINDHCFSGGISERLTSLDGDLTLISSIDRFHTSFCPHFGPVFWESFLNEGSFSDAYKSVIEVENSANDPFMF
ncbi:MAG: hypothetical protein ABIA04_08165 [Pseudomonadota bacterium]